MQRMLHFGTQPNISRAPKHRTVLKEYFLPRCARYAVPKQWRVAMTVRSRRVVVATATLILILVGVVRSTKISAQGPRPLGASLTANVLAPALPESPFDLRFFSGPVKTTPDGTIITGPGFTGQRNLVGAESAGLRAGLERFTKIMFGGLFRRASQSGGSHRSE